MPFKIESKDYENNWIEIDCAATLQAACRLASYALKRVRYLKEENMRIILDGKVVV